MKKMLLLLVCLTTFAWLHADETPAYTYQFGREYNSANAGGYTEKSKFSVTSNGIPMNFVAFNNNNTTSSSAATNNWTFIRCGSKSSEVTVTATATTSKAAPKAIGKIVINAQRYKSGENDNATSAKLLVSSNNDLSNATSYDLDFNTLTTEAKDIIINIDNPAVDLFYQINIVLPKSSSNGWLQFNKISFYEATTTIPDDKVATPVINPASGAVEAGTKVTISCSDTEAEIRYTTNGDDPTAKSDIYTAETDITVNKAMTVKAIAVKAGLDNSNIATAEYTIKKTTAANIAEFISLASTNDVYAILNPVTAVYQNGKNLYVKDSSGWLLVYGSLGKTYANGDVIAAGIKGTSEVFKGTYELSNPDASTFADGVAGTPVGPTEVKSISADIVNHYVVVKGVTISDVETNGNATATTADGTTINLYNKFNITGFEAGSNLTIKGFVNEYNKTQLLPIEITNAAGEEIVAQPTFSPVAGNVAEKTEVSIACATEGATIHYTTDGTDPSASSTEYTAPIAIDKAMTIKAIAVKEGMRDSGIAEAAYKLIVATPTFDHESGEVEKGTPVTITCFTEGATLMYQVNGGDIQVGESPVIVVINEATTIEVIASKDGYVDSEAKATYSIKGEVPVNPTATFDFTQPSTLQPALTPPLSTSLSDEERVKLDNYVFYNNYALIKFNSPDGAKGTNWSQLWNGSDGPQVRAYKGSTITITVAESLTIEKIEFVGAVSSANLKNISYTGSLGSYSYSGTTGTWTRGGGVKAFAETIGERESVSFNVNEGIRLNQISVTTTGKPTGVEDVTVDENAPVEYYNLQGVRVANPENGIYIRRQGSKVSKVLVR